MIDQKGKNRKEETYTYKNDNGQDIYIKWEKSLLWSQYKSTYLPRCLMDCCHRNLLSGFAVREKREKIALLATEIYEEERGISKSFWVENGEVSVEENCIFLYASKELSQGQ